MCLELFYGGFCGDFWMIGILDSDLLVQGLLVSDLVALGQFCLPDQWIHCLPELSNGPFYIKVNWGVTPVHFYYIGDSGGIARRETSFPRSWPILSPYKSI